MGLKETTLIEAGPLLGLLPLLIQKHLDLDYFSCLLHPD